jgi:hypothetical protein
MIVLETITPAELAKQLGWAEKRVRSLAKRLGACRVLGNRMVLLPDDVTTIMEATRPCPSKSIDVPEALSGNTGGRLPDVDSVDLLAHLTRKPRKELHPRLKTSSGNVVSMEKKRR